jgi:hypothetical protein
MIYVLIPIWAEWHDMRLFSTYAAMEVEVLEKARYRKERSVDPDWCFVIAFDGSDELKPVWNYYINKRSLRLDRFPVNQ